MIRLSKTRPGGGSHYRLSRMPGLNPEIPQMDACSLAKRARLRLPVSMRVLVVEDSVRLREGVAGALRKAGYAVDTAADGEEGHWAAQSNAYDAIILDIMLPGMDGLEILGHLRQKGNTTPILLLTARDTVPDRVKGLRAGADDYLVKPFALDELLARIEVLCRRVYGLVENCVSVGGLEIDFSRRRASVEGREITLPAREWALLEYFARRQGQVVTRTEIEEHIYDSRVDPMSNVVDAAVYALRRKLAAAGAPPLIHTRRGLGYVLEASDS